MYQLRRIAVFGSLLLIVAAAYFYGWQQGNSGSGIGLVPDAIAQDGAVDQYSPVKEQRA